MLNVRLSLWIAMLAILLCWSTGAIAETSVHGFEIPTAGSTATPSVGICGELASGPIEGGIQGRLADRRFSGTDSRPYRAALCFPAPADGPRPFVVPPAVVKAIEEVEYSLMAFFDHDSAEFNDLEALPALDVIVAWLAATPDAGLRISGHTDATGSDEYNMALSQRRAEAAKALFVARGVDPSRVETAWFGESALFVNTSDRERRNRRVEVEVFQISAPTENE